MRISTRATLETLHGQIGSLSAVGHHGRHDHTHVELCTRRKHVGDEVWAVLYEVVANLFELVILVQERQGSLRVTSIETMDVIDRVVGRILCEPVHGNPTTPERIDPLLVIPQKHGARTVTCILGRVKPGRSPCKMSHSTAQLLTLVRPAHRCRTHGLTNGHELVHELPDGRLILQHLLQLIATHPLGSLQVSTNTAHHVAVHCETLALTFPQQQHIDESPEQAVATLSVHEVARGVSQNVLHVLGQSHVQVTRVIGIGDAHGQLQREGLSNAPWSGET